MGVEEEEMVILPAARPYGVSMQWLASRPGPSKTKGEWTGCSVSAREGDVH